VADYSSFLDHLAVLYSANRGSIDTCMQHCTTTLFTEESVRQSGSVFLFTDNARMSAHSSTLCHSVRYKGNPHISTLECVCVDIRALSVNKNSRYGSRVTYTWKKHVCLFTSTRDIPLALANRKVVACYK